MMCISFLHTWDEMQIRELVLKNFRTYSELDLRPGPGLNIFVGLNAQGKSNILEAVTILSTTRSFRSGKDSEIIHWGKENARLAVRGERKNQIEFSIDIFIPQTGKKILKINQVKRPKFAELLGILNSVIFSAEDLKIVRGDPGDRRRFLDIEISQASPRYCIHLVRFKKALEQRNRLLKEIQNQTAGIETLESWNKLLIEHGSLIIQKRLEFIEKLEKTAKQIHLNLTDGEEDLVIQYHPSVPVENLSSENQNLIIAENFKKAIHNLQRAEIFRGSTLAGPHRDDLIFLINGVNARIYASQGQQRTVALSLKLAEMKLLSDLTGEIPVVLLDDFMSELDEKRRKKILELLAKDCQAFITTTTLEILAPDISSRATVFSVHGGRVECVSQVI